MRRKAIQGAVAKGLLIKLAIMLVVFVVVIPMIVPGPNGKPVMSLADWLPDFRAIEAKISAFIRDTGDSVQKKTGVDVGIERPKMYKWKDQHGNWQFSDNPADVPVHIRNAQKVDLPDVANSMQAPPKIDFGDSGANSKSKGALPLPMTISPAKIPQLIDEAKNLQQTANQRAAQLNDL